MASEIITIKQVRRFFPSIEARPIGQLDTGRTIDIGFGKSMIAPFPCVAVISAGEDGTTVRPGKDRAALGLDQQGMDVRLGQ